MRVKTRPARPPAHTARRLHLVFPAVDTAAWEYERPSAHRRLWGGGAPQPEGLWVSEQG
jgi:hypothetical protein